ncbi:MAG TPA: GNAT family N-acetyltransferase [Rubrobacteraceae bacterium]|nr:GNAT family N-acetyltransferase [Rubrobacteraceae bacterium]
MQVRKTHPVRPGGPEDVPFLWSMLYEAVHQDSKNSIAGTPREEILAKPGISHYLEGWGRPGDAAIVALDEDGRRIGAAWYRLMSPEDPGYGFINAATPEIAIAVVPEYRGRGVGGAVLRALRDIANTQGFRTLSLSVRTGNPAAVRLYERHGFRKLSEVEGSWTMRLDLTGDEDAAPNPSLTLTTMDARLAVCRLDPTDGIPSWVTSASLFSVTRTTEELSIVCLERFVPAEILCDRGWRPLKLEGPFEFSLVGVLSSVATPLAEAGVSIFAISTYDTDYVLVKEDQLELATAALRSRGHEVR